MRADSESWYKRMMRRAPLEIDIVTHVVASTLRDEGAETKKARREAGLRIEGFLSDDQ